MSKEQQEQQTAPPAPAPTNAVEASARLDGLKSDTAWRDRFLAGDGPAVKEFGELHELIAKADPVEMAIAGIVPGGDMPDSTSKLLVETATWLRDIGVSTDVARQTLSAHEVTQQEFEAVEAWKNQKMRSPEFTQRFLSGEPEEVKQMTLANIVLSSTIKSETEK